MTLAPLGDVQMLVNDDPLKEAVKTYEAQFSDDVTTGRCKSPTPSNEYDVASHPDTLDDFAV